MKPTNKFKIAVIFVSWSAVITMLFFEGRVTGWTPRHAMHSYEAFLTGELNLDNLNVQRTPGYYAFGAIIVAVLGLSQYEFLFLPMMLIPNVILLTIFVKIFSKSYLFSATIVAAMLIAGTDGVGELYLSGSRMANWLLYSVIILLLILSRNKNFKRRVSFLLSVLGIVIMYLSYNRSAELLLFFSILLVVLISIKQWSYIRTENVILANIGSKWLLSPLIIVGAFQVFFHRFLDSTLAWLISVFGRDYTGIDLLLQVWFDQSDYPSAVQELFISMPPSITYISLVRYTFILISLLAFSYICLKKIYINRYLNEIETILVSFTAAMATFAIIRLTMGHVAVVYAYLPGVLVTCYLYGNSENMKKYGKVIKIYCIIFAVSILILSSMFFLAHYHHGIVDKEQQDYLNVEAPSDWHQKYSANEVTSDELTSNLLNYQSKGEIQTDRMSQENVLQVINEKDIVDEKYFVINNNPNELRLGRWQKIQSWSYSEERINKNKGLNRIYDSGAINTYTTSKHEAA